MKTAAARLAACLVCCAGLGQAGAQNAAAAPAASSASSAPIQAIAPLTSAPAAASLDPTASIERGRALLLQRQETGCVLCHQIPGMTAGGALGPSLHGLAQRSTLAEAREQVADARRFNPQTIMPAYLSTEGLHNVAANHRGQTILNPRELEDILSYLFQPVRATP